MDPTPFNPVYNPRYAPTPTGSGAPEHVCCSSIPKSHGLQTPHGRRRSSWIDARARELAELQAALKTICTSPRTNTARKAQKMSKTPHAIAVRTDPQTGAKRKVSELHITPPVTQTCLATTSSEDPPSTRTLAQDVIRKPGKLQRAPSRLGTSSNRPYEGEGLSKTLATPLPTKPQVTQRASRALDAHISRMRRASEKKTARR